MGFLSQVNQGGKFKMVKFLRRSWDRYSKLGKGRKKKQVWRRPRGRDNKMREKRKGYPAVVSIGYKKAERIKPVLVNNFKDLEKVNKGDLVIIGNMGKKKKIEILKKAEEKKIKIHKLNVGKFLKNLEKKEKIKIEKKKLKKEESKKVKKSEKIKSKEEKK